MRYALFIFILFLAGCSSIKTYENLSQDTGIELSTHVGGKVLKVQRTSDLPNAFGAADIYGGKVNQGYTELNYQGLASDGRLVFRVLEVDTQSTETTMSRYGATTSALNLQQILVIKLHKILVLILQLILQMRKQELQKLIL